MRRRKIRVDIMISMIKKFQELHNKYLELMEPAIAGRSRTQKDNLILLYLKYLT